MVSVTSGLRANWRQFWLLVLVNGFVGAMVGLERHLVPLIAERDFGITSAAAAASFIGAFGLTKAAMNLLAGRASDIANRRTILIAGWVAALPVPFVIMAAPSWWWIVAANVLLGINQGLAWSATVIMKIDLVGAERRGLAMGLNEFAGYLAVALSTLAAGEIAARHGLRPEPFYLGIGYAAIGLALSILAVRDTTPHVRAEAGGELAPERHDRFLTLLFRASWRNRALAQCSQVGFVNNLNDGVAWGLFPLLFAARGASLKEIGLLAAVYPAAWGCTQLATGGLSDRFGRKPLIVPGMLLQGGAILLVGFGEGFSAWLAGATLLGLGTAMVYPTLIAAVGDVADPRWRATVVGVYRMWRDLGYVAGALGAGILADVFTIPAAIACTAVLTTLSGFVAAVRLPETRWHQRS